MDLNLLPKIAADLGVNRTKFQKCLDNNTYADLVQGQYRGGIQAGVSGTPGNFLLDDKGNAWVVSGAMPYETLKQVVETALKQ